MTPVRWWTQEGPLAEWGHLATSYATPTESGLAELQSLSLAEERDGLLYVPPSYSPERPAPLVLMLHGANGQAMRTIARLRELADEHELILLVPESRGRTWDLVLGGYGPDVEFIGRALEKTFRRYAVDPGRLAIEGFSDGASYALSLGITNGDLFTDILAFSPGFLLPGAPRGRPRMFVSHGEWDKVLPIDPCGRQIAATLVGGGYDLTYREFDGAHVVPPEIAREGVEWLLTDDRRRATDGP